MFERTEHRDEDHVDERAYKFFSWSYGRNGGQAGWNSTKEGLRPTATLGSPRGFRACAYCGRQALPIQKKGYSHRTGQDEYKSMGERKPWRITVPGAMKSLLPHGSTFSMEINLAGVPAIKLYPKKRWSLLRGPLPRKRDFLL